MKAFSVGKFEDQAWLIHNYEQLRHQKNVFGGSFFSILILSFFFFLTPIPGGDGGKIILLKLSIFLLFILATIGWYVKSMDYYKFCIKFLNYEYRQKRFPRKITYEITKFSTSQIIFYILMALIIPILLSLFLHDVFDLTYIYLGFGVIGGLTIFTFLLRIEDFYERRDRLEELEILTESLVYNDPLNVLRGRYSDNKDTEEIVHNRLESASFRKEKN